MDPVEALYGALAAAGIGAIIIYLIILVLLIVSYWMIFEKAGKPGWASIIPIYNAVVLLQVAKKPVWWIILLLIPFVNLIVYIVLLNAISKVFGKGGGFTVGLFFLPFIFFPILGLGSAKYQESTQQGGAASTSAE